MADDFNDAVEKAEEKIEEKKDELEQDIEEAKAELKETFEEAKKEVDELEEKVKAKFAPIKKNFGQVCDFLDNRVFGKVRKCYIAFGGLVLALLVWIF